MQITGTFIDEISHDIPSANWGPKQWAQDFDAMKAIGIDTVIIIRAGYQNMCIFPSTTLQQLKPPVAVPYDLFQVLLDQAQRCGMKLYCGTYDSGHYWLDGDYQREVDINKAFTEEIVSRYGQHPAFQGWYISHEIATYNPAAIKVYQQLAQHLKNLLNRPILISPYIHGKKQFADQAIDLTQHIDHWNKIFSQIADAIDIVAFQDGNVDFHELPDYLAANIELTNTYNLTAWSNVESFDRDMPIKFPPITWPKLLSKIQSAHQAGVDKLITFEFSHFMSPNSIYPAAQNLYQRYHEYLQEQRHA